MKNLTFGIIIGILLAVVVGLGYSLFSLGSDVKANKATLSQVVSFLNEQIAKNAPATTPVTR